MKIILSRKGFDSQYGKINSPILPDGTLLSLPIPQQNDTIKYDQLIYQDKTYLQIINDLSPNWNKNYPNEQTAHLDPDLRIDTYKDRKTGWRAIFGQSAAAQGHLNKQGVGIGDIFLFFGSFAKTKIINEKYTYVKELDYPNGSHIIFGYLQIGEIHRANQNNEFPNLPEYAKQHSHANREYRDHKGNERKKNCMYITSDKLTSLDSSLPGAGTLKYSKSRILTKKGMKKSMWDLPMDIFKKQKISYHSEKSIFPNYFQSAAKGQEFIIDANEEIIEWVKKIVIG